MFALYAIFGLIEYFVEEKKIYIVQLLVVRGLVSLSGID
jgi:hypothetical protein